MLTELLKLTMRFLGRLWGGSFLKFVIFRYTIKRVGLFELRVSGLENLDLVKDQHYILVSNHVFCQDTLLKIFETIKPLRRFNHAVDSFVFQKIIYDRTQKWIRVVAKYGRDDWNANAVKRYLQRNVRQPLTRGQLEGVGYIPVDLKNGVLQREFLKTIESVIHNREPILIFPEGDVFDEFQTERSLRSGAAHIARKYQAAILPAYIQGSESWRPGRRIMVRFGPPIYTQDLSKQQIGLEIMNRIVELQRVVAADEECSVPA